MKPNASPVAAALLAISSSSYAVAATEEPPAGDGVGAVSSSESAAPSGERRLLKRDEILERRGSAQLRGSKQQGEESRALNNIIMSLYDAHRKPTNSNLFLGSKGKTQVGQVSQPATTQIEPETRTVHAPGCGGSGTYHSPYLGCWDDKNNDRAFPFELYEGHSSSKRFGHGALDCERECSQRGYRYFGRQFKGQCFCGTDLSQITRHGRENDCDCCGANVGSSRFCLWENSKSEDSSAQAPYIEPVLPQRPQQITSTENSHHLAADGGSDSQGTSTKPTGGFRLRMHWERGYMWQGDPREKWFCMECRGDCRRDSSVMVAQCDSSIRQRWLAVGKTLRPASNPSLCVTVRGYSGKHNPVRLRNCNHGGDQRFNELKSSGKFELHCETRDSHCLSQHHQ